MSNTSKLDPYAFYFIRQSPIVLVTRLFFLEFIFLAIYLLVRVPKVLISPALPDELFAALNSVSVIIFLALSVLQVIFAVFITLSWTNEYYIIRSGDILHRKGTFTLNEETFSLRNVEAFTVDETFWGKIFGYGTIKFFSPVLKTDYYLMNVPNPLELKKTIERIVAETRDGGASGEMIIPIRRR